MRGQHNLYPFPQKKDTTTNCIGFDLHKQSITLCIVNQNRTALARKRILSRDPKGILALLEQWKKPEMVVEATASYEKFAQLAGPQ